MPYRPFLATMIQSAWRGYRVRTDQEMWDSLYPYTAPAYRNILTRYRSREDFERNHFGVEYELGDCLHRGLRHGVIRTPLERFDDFYCDWCAKDIEHTDQYRWTCEDCDFDICCECVAFAVQNETSDLWRVCYDTT